MWAIIGPWECKCIPGSKWPIPIEHQMVRVHFSFFVNNCFTRNTRKFYFKNLSPFPEIMLRGSLILISQIMVMNNKEYTLRELLPNFDLNQFSRTKYWFLVFEKSVISQKIHISNSKIFQSNILKLCILHHSPTWVDFQTGSWVKLFRILILFKFSK